MVKYFLRIYYLSKIIKYPYDDNGRCLEGSEFSPSRSRRSNLKNAGFRRNFQANVPLLDGTLKSD